MNVEDLIRESIDSVKGESEKTSSDASFDSEDIKKISGYLIKCASYAYNPESYKATCGIMKIAGESMSKAIDEIEKIANKVNQLEKASKVRGIIDDMREKELIDDYDTQEKVAELLKKDDRELEIVKEAMKMAGQSQKNIFFQESEKTASNKTEKPGMFDNVIDGA